MKYLLTTTAILSLAATVSFAQSTSEDAAGSRLDALMMLEGAGKAPPEPSDPAPAEMPVEPSAPVSLEETLFIAGPVTVERIVPALVRKDGVETVPFPFVAQQGVRVDTAFGHQENPFRLGGRQESVVLDQVELGSLRFDDDEASLPRTMRTNVAMSGEIVALQTTKAIISASAGTSVAGSSDRSCTLTLEIDDQPVFTPETKEGMSSSEDVYEIAGSSMITLERGRHDFRAEIYCPAMFLPGEVQFLSVGGGYLAADGSEAPLQLLDLEEVDDQPDASREGDHQPAMAAIWTAASAEALRASDPVLGNISQPVQLVEAFGQQFGLSPTDHRKTVGIRSFFYPEEPGTWHVKAVSDTNICHAGRSGDGYTQEHEGVTFDRCDDQDFRHPAVSVLALGSDRAVIASTLQGSEDAVLERIGALEVTEQDVANGLVLEIVWDGEIGLLTGNRTVDCCSTQKALINDRGETYESITGKAGKDMWHSKGHQPTADEKAFMTGQILIKGPGEDAFRPFNEADVSKED